MLVLSHGGVGKIVIIFNQLFSFLLFVDINKESYDSNQHCYDCYVHKASKHILCPFSAKEMLEIIVVMALQSQKHSFRICRGRFA